MGRGGLLLNYAEKCAPPPVPLPLSHGGSARGSTETEPAECGAEPCCRSRYSGGPATGGRWRWLCRRRRSQCITCGSLIILSKFEPVTVRPVVLAS